MKCDGLRECEINTRELEQDPCFGTYKYYTTNHICIPAETSVTCQDGYSYLKRSEQFYFNFDTANYGRTDKIICSEGRPSSELQNTNCYSPNALAPVSKSCNGLESCEVFATHTVFADPCVGIYKYLTISYFCVPPAVHECSSVICEHANNTLMCAECYFFSDQGTVIRIHSTNYGRTDSSTCSTGRPASQLAKTDCYASNSQAMTTYGCKGKNSCSLVASNGVFSDPCTNTFKYPYVSYSCIHNCKCYCVQ
ncbi:rhamnose-binding lectin-like [Sinocyclocheilus anshuiensis]|uniref:rhamnose-binding lectin-like n=1 Tax=Sinocyclocheilus anshuiensis TaxID=1608454 RepID=UPI0007B9DE5C|nr:PREDICTED: rhamnose-binding lectin-like [Sinocyclocheilus anshuiensis]